MAKKQTSVRKREREAVKRQRAMAKSQKAAEKRERRHNKPDSTSGSFLPPSTNLEGGDHSSQAR